MHALLPLLAHAGGWHHDHWWVVFPILWLLLAAFVVVVLFRRRGRGAHDGGDPARKILGERFARGEINADEYRERLAQLR